MLTLGERIAVVNRTAAGECPRSVAAALGVRYGDVFQACRYGDRDEETAYLPTPDEIAAACKRIQAGWAPEERESRRVGVGCALAPQIDDTLFDRGAAYLG